jgi:hypothetical protein
MQLRTGHEAAAAAFIGSLTKVDGRLACSLEQDLKQLDLSGKLSCDSLTAKTRTCRRKAKAA